ARIQRVRGAVTSTEQLDATERGTWRTLPDEPLHAGNRKAVTEATGKIQRPVVRSRITRPHRRACDRGIPGRRQRVKYRIGHPAHGRRSPSVVSGRGQLREWLERLPGPEAVRAEPPSLRRPLGPPPGCLRRP